MNNFKITLVNKNDVTNFVNSFGTSMSLILGSSFVCSDVAIDVDTLKRLKLLETSVGKTLKIYFRKHGTFTNFTSNPEHDIDFWSEKNEIVGILNIEVESTNTYNIYYEKYE